MIHFRKTEHRRELDKVAHRAIRVARGMQLRASWSEEEIAEEAQRLDREIADRIAARGLSPRLEIQTRRLHAAQDELEDEIEARDSRRRL